MWLLREGRIIRVDLEIDPCWNTMDIWKAQNLFARFKSLGYSSDDCAIYASALVWKNKWSGTKYSDEVESTLSAIQLRTVSEITCPS